MLALPAVWRGRPGGGAFLLTLAIFIGWEPHAFAPPAGQQASLLPRVAGARTAGGRP